MQLKETNIVLVLRSGGDFKLSDVYLLATHIHKYWSSKLRPNIICFTDTIQEPHSVVGLTFKPLPVSKWTGWWSKINLFSPSLQELRPFLYLDLDTAVIGNLQNLVPQKGLVDKFIMLEDFYRKNKAASGVMWVPNNDKVNVIWNTWLFNWKTAIKEYRGDQNYVEAICPPDELWQKLIGEVVTSFKPNRKWRTELPVKSTVVCFHGSPRIPEAAKTVEWVNDYIKYAI